MDRGEMVREAEEAFALFVLPSMELEQSMQVVEQVDLMLGMEEFAWRGQ
jgi:hypothetical protein